MGMFLDVTTIGANTEMHRFSFRHRAVCVQS